MVRLKWITVVSIFVLMAAACAEDGGTSADDSSGGNGGEGVAIGALVPLTGELGAVGQPTAAQFEFATEQINETGLNPCGDIELIVEDQGDAENAIRAAREMINNEDVVALVGTTSDVTVALADTAKTEQVVLFSPYAGTITLNRLGGDFVFRAVPSDAAGGEAATEWILEQGYEKPAFMILNEESPISISEVAIDLLEQEGVSTAAKVIFNPGQPSYEGDLNKALSADPDVIFLAGGQESGATIIREAANAGYEGDWYLTSDMAVPEIIDIVGADVMDESFYGGIPSPDTTLPAYKSWLEKFTAATDEEPHSYSANSWDVIHMLALAMSAGDGCDGAAINENLDEISHGGTPVSTYEEGAELLAEGEDIDYEGASGPLAFDETGTPPGSFTVLQVRDGKWKTAKFYPAEEFLD